MVFRTLIRSSIYNEQEPSIKQGLAVMKEEEKKYKFSKKSVNRFQSYRPSQAILALPIDCWTSQEAIPINYKSFHA